MLQSVFGGTGIFAPVMLHVFLVLCLHTGRDHYGLQPRGFVMRPNGDSWSQHTSEIPRLGCSVAPKFP